MSDFRCPHCRTALPEKATFCAACGRRIEGWSAGPAGATPALGEPALTGDDAATRQVEPTPSLMRAVALSRRRERSAPRWWIGIGMLVVALTGGVAAFFLVRLHRQSQPRPQTIAQAPEPMEEAPPPAAATVVPSVAPAVVAAPPNPAVPTRPPATTKPRPPAIHPLVAKSPPQLPLPKPVVKAPRTVPLATGPTHLAAPRAPHAKLPPGNGLPHKAVHTDSQSIAQQTVKQEKQAKADAKTQARQPAAPSGQSLQMPTVAHETSEAPSSTGSPADERAEAQASLDADGVRFVVRAHLPQVRACYGRVFKDASPGGTVEVGFAIDANGRAKNVRTERNSTESELLSRCLETRVKEWQFPRPVGGDFELIYPFVFAPGS